MYLTSVKTGIRGVFLLASFTEVARRLCILYNRHSVTSHVKALSFDLFFPISEWIKSLGKRLCLGNETLMQSQQTLHWLFSMGSLHYSSNNLILGGRMHTENPYVRGKYAQKSLKIGWLTLLK